MTMPRFTMPEGPQITPKTLKAAGQGGQMNPAYMQMRVPTQVTQPTISAPKPAYSGQATQAVTGPPKAPSPALQQPQAMSRPGITPAAISAPVPPQSTATPGQAPFTPAPQITPFQSAATQYAQASAMQPVTPSPAGQPVQAGGRTLGDVYNFFASDLANQMRQAKAGSIADAAARGVYYGTPLTGSEADINTQYLRGLGQLQAGMYGNEQQNILARLGLGESLGWQGAMQQPPLPTPVDWSSLGAIFGGLPQVPSLTAPRPSTTLTQGVSREGGNVPP